MANFCVTGEFLTDRARHMVLEDDWTFAAQYLVDALDGITEDQALAVLKGTHRLTGSNDIQYLEEDEAGLAAARALYASTFDCRGTLLFKGKRYQPYAYVDSFSIQDALIPGLPPEAPDSVAREWSIRDWFHPDVVWKADQVPVPSALRRAMHYADNPQRDIACKVTRHDGSTAFALFEPAYDSFPPWMTCFRTPQEAFSAAESSVRVWGHKERYPQSRATPEEQVAHDDAVAGSMSLEDEAELALRREVEIAEELVRKQAFDGEVVTVRAKVVKYANQDAEYGWQTFRYADPESGESCVLKAPRRAMIAYALSKTSAMHLRPAYKAFSPANMKLLHDNPLHTDAWLGCGFELGDAVYDRRNIRVRAFNELAYDIQKNLLGYKAHILASAGMKSFDGHVVTADSKVITNRDILVVPTAGVEYDVAASQAGAIVCEVGGPLAHLVPVSRERGMPVLRVENATQLYRTGMHLLLDLEKGEVKVIADLDLTGGIDYSLL